MSRLPGLIIFVIVAVVSFPNYAATSKCEELRWKLAKRDGEYGIYRGHVKAGTSAIHMELRNNKGSHDVVATGYDSPNPGGTWEIHVWADRNIKKGFRAKFYCETY